jgi:hypothetical protein
MESCMCFPLTGSRGQDAVLAPPEQETLPPGGIWMACSPTITGMLRDATMHVNHTIYWTRWFEVFCCPIPARITDNSRDELAEITEMWSTGRPKRQQPQCPEGGHTHALSYPALR